MSNACKAVSNKNAILNVSIREGLALDPFSRIQGVLFLNVQSGW